MTAARGLLLAMLSLVGLAGCSAAVPAGAVQVIAVGDRQPAPALRGEMLDGAGTFDVANHTGDVVVVNFWAQWCAPCVAEADDLEQTYLATKDDGVTFLGVNTRDERDKARRFVVGRVSYPSVFDPAGRLALGFAVPPTSLPATLILDRKGRVAVVIRRAVLREDLVPLVTSLAAESP